MQTDGEDGEQPIDVGLRIQRFVGLGAMPVLGKTVAMADHPVSFW